MLNYDETAFSAIAIDAYVPERMFRAVRVSCEGGSVAVSNVCADDVSIQTAGGRADVSDVSGRRGLIESEGGAISAVNLDIENMKIETNNAPIQLSITNLSKYGEYTWCVETGNGRIVASLPSAHGLGYHVKARSALGGVKIGLTGLSFLHNMPANTEARSANFDTCATRVKLDLENSNEDIVIN
ncbi:MAG: DUF4097 domain-containing protein [Defluviitaleaceae bacterium]|nr:DUF4097 domain-containing protein [Defluviitaleaceae bacterium]